MCPNRTLLIVAVVFAAAGAEPRAQSSEPPNNAPIQVGALVLAPVVRLTNVGHDSNVFNRSDDDDRRGDVTATLSPSVDGWLRMAHARANGRAQFDGYYFKRLTDLRAIDSDTIGHIEVPMNRILAYATGSFTSTRHRQNLEIDALARRRSDSVTAGMDVRLTAKGTVGVFARQVGLHYDANSLYQGTDLARVLNHSSGGGGADLRYALTSLTTIGVGLDISRDRFDIVSDRDSVNRSVIASVQFKPRALISGGASLGVLKHEVVSGTAPEFNGSVATADLTYTLLGRTRFTVTARRQLEYSYIDDTDYLRGGVDLRVAQRLGDSWDIGGSFGRDRLSYRRRLLAGASVPVYPDETVFSSSGGIHYNFGHTQLGVDVEYRERLADQALAFRGYQRLRIGSTLTYAF